METVYVSLDTLSRIPHGYRFRHIPNESPPVSRQLPVLSTVTFPASRHLAASRDAATQTDLAASLDAATQTDVIAPEMDPTWQRVLVAIGPRDSTANSRHLTGHAASSASAIVTKPIRAFFNVERLGRRAVFTVERPWRREASQLLAGAVRA